MPNTPTTHASDDATPTSEGDLRYRVEAVTRAVRLLRELREAQPRDIEELARTTDIPPAFAELAMETLGKHGLVRKTVPDAGGWRLGLSWLRMAEARRRQVDLRELALPIMRRMRDDVDETVILAIRRGSRRVNIDYVESTQAIRRMTQHGYETALHVGAAGRSLLCCLSPDELGDYFANITSGVGRSTKLFDVAQYLRELEGVRESGFAIARGEMAADAPAVSAPVRDHTGDVIAALTISCPGDRFTPGLEAACIAATRSGTGELSRLLGFMPACTKGH